MSICLRRSLQPLVPCHPPYSLSPCVCLSLFYLCFDLSVPPIRFIYTLHLHLADSLFPLPTPCLTLFSVSNPAIERGTLLLPLLLFVSPRAHQVPSLFYVRAMGARSRGACARVAHPASPCTLLFGARSARTDYVPTCR